ncbi:MAG: DegT/DnrJ/EryC1/StrS family aminotransferase [Candidatus Brocadiia bacterium]
MYRIGDEEVEAIRKLFNSGQVFRYGKATECNRFEERFAKMIGVKYLRLCNSGTSALIAALIGMGIGPGDDVIVPAYTYMASAMAVLGAGAIPVVAEVDESLTLDPEDAERKITDRTAAIMPVHMMGLSCDMNSLCRVASDNDVMVCEDSCQAVGGSYEGQKLGSFGEAGGFSFNYYKNITAGEGGAFATDSEEVFERGSCVVDPCSYYWDEDREFAADFFVPWNFRSTEIAGAVLNVQLDRLDGMLETMRKQKKILTRIGRESGLQPIVSNSPDWECGSAVGFIFPEDQKAISFTTALGEEEISCFRPIDTGRHVYTNWDPIMKNSGSHHPSLDPFNLDENADANTDYTDDMCARSLDLLGRTVLISTHPFWPEGQVEKVGEAIRAAAN